MKSLILTLASLAIGIPANLVMARPAVAQAAADKLAGTWEGPYTTDGPTGTMTTVVSKDGTGWAVKNTLSGDVPPAGDAQSITVEGNILTWTQMIGEYEVHFKATLAADGAKVDGTIEAYQGGSVVAGGSFTMTKKV